MSFAKGGDVREASYANGGPVLGRTKDFLKEPDRFRGLNKSPKPEGSDEDYGKSGKGSKGKDKSLPVIKPRS